MARLKAVRLRLCLASGRDSDSINKKKTAGMRGMCRVASAKSSGVNALYRRHNLQAMTLSSARQSGLLIHPLR